MSKGRIPQVMGESSARENGRNGPRDSRALLERRICAGEPYPHASAEIGHLVGVRKSVADTVIALQGKDLRLIGQSAHRCTEENPVMISLVFSSEFPRTSIEVLSSLRSKQLIPVH